MSDTSVTVAAWDVAYGSRFEASSVELRALRVAAAAHRLREHGSLTDSDRAVVAAVVDGLREEARVLRREHGPDISNETFLAFAGSTLRAEGDDMLNEQEAATRLDELAGQLQLMVDDQRPGDGELQVLETLFERTSNNVSRSVSQTGEKVDGSPVPTTDVA